MAASGHVRPCSRALCILLLLYALTSAPESQDQFVSSNGFSISSFNHSWKPQASHSENLNLSMFHSTKWRTLLRVTERIKRTKAATALYGNSSSTFRLIIQLMHDIEVNPGPNNYTVGTQKKTNNVKIAHLNVRSLKRREHFILVKESILANKFDVFTISETWLNNTVSDLELEIPGYSLHRLDRQTKKGGGVCVYVLQSYKTEVLGEISYISSTDFHQLWIKIQVRNLKSIIICTTYRPPDTTVSCFNTDLTPSLITASLLDKTIYILGDLNCNLLNSSCPDSRALTNFCLTYNLSQMVTSPTQVTNLTETLIDVILVSNAKQVLKTEVLQSSISDHDLVYALLRLKQQRPKPTYINIRSFKHYDLNKFHTDVSQAPWSILDTFDDPEDKLYAFDSLFNDILDEHAPVKTIKIRGRENACVTDEIRELMKTRDYWKAKARKLKDPLHWSAYKNFHREVKREIRMAEREFATEQIINNKNNTNSIWKAIRTCIPKKSASQRNYSKDDKTVANEFNSFFASVGDNTIKKIEVLAREANYNLGKCSFVPKNYSLPDQFTFSTVPHNQVESIVKSMASNKAPGIDKVPIRVIKECLPAILPSITSIINATFESAIFPNMWKIAVLTPIPKEGDDEVPNNNRPISLLPVLSKVCERVAHNQFSSYLLSRDHLSCKQSGNKQWHSTETSLIHTTDTILSAIDKKKLTAVVLLDMSKAFDSINHQILLEKLQDVGASPPVIHWFYSYSSS